MLQTLNNIQFEQKAKVIRGMILDQIVAFKNGHIASAFSCIEILLALYHGEILHIDPSTPDWPDRDRFILSKGHGVSALYAILADLEFFPQKWLTAPQDGNLLGGHADRKVPGIDWSTGSLGHGLPVAAGMALAAKMDKKDYRVFCLLGDGELQEGSVWEAAMFAAHHKLDNLLVLIDRNGNQSCGRTEEILNIRVLLPWVAFGWECIHVQGHIIADLQDVLSRRPVSGPTAIIAYTTKGKGVSFIEAENRWHTSVPTEDEILAAKRELGLL